MKKYKYEKYNYLFVNKTLAREQIKEHILSILNGFLYKPCDELTKQQIKIFLEKYIKEYCVVLNK